MTPRHILFVRLYLSESPGTAVDHLEYYAAVPLVLESTREGQELFDAIRALIESKSGK